MTNEYSVKVKVTIHKETSFFGPGIAHLIKNIDEIGSVKEACVSMGLSYSKGWFILNRAEQELGYPLIRRSHGGKDGGGASLTDEGHELLRKFDELESRVAAYAREAFDEIFMDAPSESEE